MQRVRKKGILNGTNDAAAEGGIIARLLSRHDSFSNYHRLCALSRFFGSTRNMEFKSRGDAGMYDGTEKTSCWYYIRKPDTLTGQIELNR